MSIDWDRVLLEFPEEEVGYRPVIWCADCDPDNPWACVDGHKVELCEKCGQYKSTAHTHVAYIPHARIEERLRDIDPTWSWEPLAKDEQGRPAMDGGCLWITLRIGGRTEIGVGDAPGEVSGRARRQSISSAIKNAAERLGVGRYLKLLPPEPLPPEAVKPLPDRPVKTDSSKASALIDEIMALCQGKNPAVIEAEFAKWSPNPGQKKLHSASPVLLAEYKDHLKAVRHG
jgi:hypothetical protein